MRKIHFFIISSIVLIGCQSTGKTAENVDYSVPEITHHNYFEVENYSIIWSKMFDIQKEKYFLYFYSTSCNHCAELKDWIISKALERGDVYFIKSSENDVIKKEISSTIGKSTPNEMAIVGYPSLVEIKEYRVYKNVAGKTQIQNLLNSQ